MSSPFLGVRALGERIRRLEVSVEEIVRVTLARIERVDLVATAWGHRRFTSAAKQSAMSHYWSRLRMLYRSHGQAMPSINKATLWPSHVRRLTTLAACTSHRRGTGVRSRIVH